MPNSETTKLYYKMRRAGVSGYDAWHELNKVILERRKERENRMKEILDVVASTSKNPVLKAIIAEFSNTPMPLVITVEQSKVIADIIVSLVHSANVITNAKAAAQEAANKINNVKDASMVIAPEYNR